MKRFALILFLLIAISAVDLMAQEDPFGAVDSLFVDQVSIVAGREFTINVNLWNDEELGAVTIPLKYPADKMQFINVSFAGGRLAYLSSRPVTVDTIAGTVLVGAIVFLEEYIQPGNGLLYSITFKLRDNALPGEIFTLDSTFVDPAYLLLSHSSAVNIFPYFRAGRVTITGENHAPYFQMIPTQYVAEGESLHITMRVIDPDGDPVDIANPIHPFNSQFADNGDGTARFDWRPDYVGPLSSDLSPFYFVFWASDGGASSYVRVRVNVINVNRAPQIIAPTRVDAEAGDSLGILVRATDPEFDPLTWQISGLPAGAVFDFDNPGLISWKSNYADSGEYTITLIARDPLGLADTADLLIDLAPVTLFTIRIDTLTTFSGRTVEMNVFLKNRLDIREFNLIINFDPAILNPLRVTRNNARAQHLDQFFYNVNNNGFAGDVRIFGRAGNTGQLPPGDGLLFRIEVLVSSDLAYIGSEIPVRFATRTFDDNKIKLHTGQVFGVPEVNLFDGYVLIASPGIRLLGDINLNGVAYEISDAVYFSNFFISPGIYPLNERQILNSDINSDGFAPSVADLVLMIKVISGEVLPPTAKPVVAEMPEGAVLLTREPSGIYLKTNSSLPLAGAWFKLEGPDVALIEANNKTEMDLMSDIWRTTLNCLLISYTGRTITAGETTVIKLSDSPNLRVTLADADLADADGRTLPINKKQMAALPSQFALHQNYPNPFNPTTQIQFDLPSPARVNLTVFNILGQVVVRLADADYPAGQHSVVWDGIDGAGNMVASGVYLYRIKIGEFENSRKMILLK